MSLVARGYSGRVDVRWLLPLIAGEHVLPAVNLYREYNTNPSSEIHSHYHICIYQLSEMEITYPPSNVPNQPRQKHESTRGKTSNPPCEHQEQSNVKVSKYVSSRQRKKTTYPLIH
jgi:hypothetical protein